MYYRKSVLPALFAGFFMTACGGGSTPTLPTNQAPQITVADLNVEEQIEVTLAADVTDDGTIASLQWQQTAGVTVELQDSDQLNAKFMAPTVLMADGPQTLTFSLTATDDKGSTSEANIDVVVNPVNDVPLITVENLAVAEQTEVTLGANVTDDGSIASLQWQQTAGVTVELQDSDQLNAKFVAPTVLMADGPQTLSFSLTANDDEGATALASLDVVVDPVNQAPIATITPPEGSKSFGGLAAMLNGADSSDPDGSIVSYQWQQIDGDPVTSNAFDQSQLSFNAQNKASTLQFQLTVTDNEGATALATVILDNQPHFLQVGVGSRHYCALVQDHNGHDVYCWGNDSYSMLDIPELSNPTNIYSDEFVNCALDETGVKCWGFSQYGQLELPDLTNPQDISIGRYHTCALDDNGISCWGTNYSGETDVPPLNNPKKVVTGYLYSCALDDNSVNCWGDTSEYSQVKRIFDIPAMNGVTDIFGGKYHVCAIYEGGLKCWGKRGEDYLVDLSVDPSTILDVTLGEYTTCLSVGTSAIESQTNCYGGNFSGSDVPLDGLDELRVWDSAGDKVCSVHSGGIRCWGSWFADQTQPPAFDTITQLASGIVHSCAIGRQGNVDNQLECWGLNWSGISNMPTITHVSKISANDEITCAIDDSSAHCWGVDPSAIILDPMPSSSEFPIPSMQNVTAIEPGYSSICAIHDGGVKCWGDNTFGQLEVPTLTNPTLLASGDTMHCVVADEGLKCWGTNWGDELTQPAPELHNVTSLTAEDNFACAIDNNQVYCWGENYNGVLDIPTLVNPIKVVAGPRNACALDDSGLVCWGANDYGELRIPPLSNVKDVTVGYRYICALDDTGLVCWGWQGYGNNPVPSREQVQADIGLSLSKSQESSKQLDPTLLEDPIKAKAKPFKGPLL